MFFTTPHDLIMTVAYCPHQASAPSTPARIRTPCSSNSSSTTSFFQLPTTKKRNKQTRLLEQRQMEIAAAEEEATLRAQAWLYLHDFIDASPVWSEMSSQITIVRDEVPTMPELNSYGELDEKEGTRACRRLFKAVVVWDELGHNLWRTLREAAEQRALARKQFEPPEWLAGLDGFADDYSAAREQSRRRGSEDSCGSAVSLCSVASGGSVVAAAAAAAAAAKKTKRASSSPRARIQLSKKLSGGSSSSNRRASSDTEREADGADVGDAARCHHEQRSAIPRIISHNCASAVRRTLGVFVDSRTGPSATGRQAR